MDYNATTPLAPEVLEAIHTALRDAWGNPSSAHQAGMKKYEDHYLEVNRTPFIFDLRN